MPDGAKLGLVEHLLRELGAGGSNPLTPTNEIAVLSAFRAALAKIVSAAHFSQNTQISAKTWHTGTLSCSDVLAAQCGLP